MAPTLRPAQRKKAKMRVAVLGPSGSGKTYSALLLARGLASAWDKVALIDSENGSGDLYEHLGPYNVITLSAFSPASYIEAIEACEAAGMEAVVVDSASHEWEWCKNEADKASQNSKSGNSFSAWGPVGKLHDTFLRKLNTSTVHMVECARTKQDYVLEEKNGKKVPVKVGIAAVQRDGFEYEFTVVLELDMAHKAYATKDRTRIFEGKEPKVITQETGSALLAWAQEGVEPEKAPRDDQRPDWDAPEAKPKFTAEALSKLAAVADKYESAHKLMELAATKYELTQDDMANIRAAFEGAKKKPEEAKVKPKAPQVTPYGKVYSEWNNAKLPRGVLETRKKPETLVQAIVAALDLPQGTEFNPQTLTDEQSEKVVAAIKERNADLIDPQA